MAVRRESVGSKGSDGKGTGGRFARDVSGSLAQNIPTAFTDIPRDVLGQSGKLNALPDTRAAFLKVMSEADPYADDPSLSRHERALLAAKRPQRIKRIVLEEPQRCREPSLSILEYGYDPRVGRVEVIVQHTDPQTGAVTVGKHAYCNVSDIDAKNVTDWPSSGWYKYLRGNPNYQYQDADEAMLAGAAPRCPDCGQYSDDTHVCPRTASGTAVEFAFKSNDEDTPVGEAWTNQSVSVASQHEGEDYVRMDGIQVPLPPKASLSAVVDNGHTAVISVGVMLHRVPELDGVVPAADQGEIVSGKVHTWRNQSDELVVDTRQLICSCASMRDYGHCRHVDAIEMAVRDRIAPLDDEARRARNFAAIQEATRIVENRDSFLLDTDWTREPAQLVDARGTWRKDTETLYSDEPLVFLNDVKEALRSGGLPEIRLEDALDGECRRGEGPAFGVEIEYEFPADMSAEEIRYRQKMIGVALYEAGLTYSPDQQEKGAIAKRGYRDTLTDELGVGNFSFEVDGSVSGEIVSPGLYDERDSWIAISTVCRILDEYGAVAGSRAGLHVHVGSAGYSVADYAEAARIVTHNEDSLVRMSSSPINGRHRNNGYAKPLPVVPEGGFQDVPSLRRWQSEGPYREAFVNFFNCYGRDSDHVEFRGFDASLNPGVIQANIMMSVAVLGAARRNTSAGVTSSAVKEPWGAHTMRSRVEGSPASIGDLVEDTVSYRSLVDTLFRRHEDKKTMASLFSATYWSEPARMSTMLEWS